MWGNIMHGKHQPCMYMFQYIAHNRTGSACNKRQKCQYWNYVQKIVVVMSSASLKSFLGHLNSWTHAQTGKITKICCIVVFKVDKGTHTHTHTRARGCMRTLHIQYILHVHITHTYSACTHMDITRMHMHYTLQAHAHTHYTLLYVWDH